MLQLSVYSVQVILGLRWAALLKVTASVTLVFTVLMGSAHPVLLEHTRASMVRIPAARVLEVRI